MSSVVQDVRQLGHTGTPPTLSVTQDDQAFPKFLAQQQALKAAAPKPASASPTPAATTTSPKKGNVKLLQVHSSTNKSVYRSCLCTEYDS